MVRVRFKWQFCNYSSCRILQFLELITQVATQTVPYRASIIEIWLNQSVIKLKGSFFRNKGLHTFESTYSWGYFLQYIFLQSVFTKLVGHLTPKYLVCSTCLMIWSPILITTSSFWTDIASTLAHAIWLRSLKNLFLSKSYGHGGPYASRRQENDH